MVRLSPAFEQSMIFVVFLICVLCTNLCFASDDLDEAKPRRGGTVGLFAYPRVGRSDPSMINWENVPNSYEEYDDQPKFDVKRQGLFPFPRVGRADNNQLRKWSKLALQQQQGLDKRSGASANSGLWFGPRLGRIQKRSAGMPADDESRLDIYTPRLGRESEETVNPDYDYDIILTDLADLKNMRKPMKSNNV